MCYFLSFYVLIWPGYVTFKGSVIFYWEGPLEIFQVL